MQEFSDKSVQLATRIPKGLHRALRLFSVDSGRSMMAIVSEALVEHLARCQDTSGSKRAPGRRQVTVARRKRTLLAPVPGEG